MLPTKTRMGIYKSSEDRYGSWVPPKSLELNFAQVGVQEPPPKRVVVGWRATDLLCDPSRSLSTPSQGGKPGTRQQSECLGPTCQARFSIQTLALVLHKPSLNFESKPLPGTFRPAGRAAIAVQCPAWERAVYRQQRARCSSQKSQREA